MSYGSPTSDVTSAVYSITVEHTNGAILLISGQFQGFGETPQMDMDEAFQDLVTLVDGSADFVINDSRRVYDTTQSVSP